jgi:anti-sigma factor RsiW
VSEPPEMDCRELVELVTEYLERALAPAAVARFEAHIAECDGCARYVEQMSETIFALGHLPPEALSPEVEMRMLTAFRGWRQGRP